MFFLRTQHYRRPICELVQILHPPASLWQRLAISELHVFNEIEEKNDINHWLHDWLRPSIAQESNGEEKKISYFKK
jgi:hypothetical protein